MKRSISLAALFYSVLLFEPAFAVQTYFNTNFGDWTNAANWSTGVVPTAEDYAYIDNGGQANLTAASATIWSVLVGVGNGNNKLAISNGGALSNGASGGAGYVGYTSSNNTALVTGTGSLWQNDSDLYVGWGTGALRNTLVISNGGRVASANPYGFANFGGYTYIGYEAAASGNNALITGADSLLTNTRSLFVGHTSGGNSLVVSNGGKVANADLFIGYTNVATNNSALITGTDSLLTNARSLVVGQVSGGNSLVVSNGGKVANADLFIGYTNVATNNSVQVTGTGSLLTNSGNMYVGAGSRSIYGIAPHGGYNSLTIADGGTAASVDGFIGYANFASYNTVQVTGTNSLWTNSRDLYVGFSGRGNRLVITNGGEVFAGGNLVISAQAGATNTYFFDNPTNSVSVGGGRLVVTNGQINVGAATPGALYVTGGTVEVKTLTATNGTNSAIAFNGGAINSSATAINNGTNFTIGDTGSGAAFTARVGTHTFASDLVVGNTGSSNSLVITNGGEVFIGTNMVLSVQAGASNNSVSISSGRLVMTNGTLEIGRAGSGTLSIHGGTVEAPSIVVASQAGSSGTLNIGRFGTNDSAGTINAPTIAFGSGAGVVNFNQSNATTISAVISGAGTLRQLGSGTTTLSASNTYTGGTTISAGTLELDNTGSVAGNITNNATLSINRTNSLTLTNLVSGTGALSKSGAGTVIFTGANTYSGGTTISAGTLQINAGGVVSNSATTLVGSGGSGTLNISGGTYSNLNVSIGHSGGTGILNLNSGSLSAQNLTVSGNSAAAGTLNLNGGTMAVAGSFYVASGGTINVNTGGVLRGGDGGHLWVDITNSLVNFNGGTGSAGLNLFVGNGGTVDLKGQSLGTNNWGNLIASAPGGVLRNSGTNASTIATVNTIWLWQGGQKLTIDASGGDILINSWITSSQMTNTGIIKTGSNALVLTYSGNDYNGGTLLQQGSLRLDHANAAGSGAITQSNAASTLQINATGTVSNAMSLYNIATLQTVTLSGSKTLNGSTYNIAAGTTTTESGVLSGAGGLTKSGTGTMTLSASNSYSGDTTISSGVLALTNGFSIADTADVTNSGATLRVDSGETIGSLRGSGSTVLNGMAVTLTIAETNSHAYAGVISGAGGFAKTGGGTTTLAGSNTYSGDTTVGGGRLAVTGSISGSNAVYVGNEASGNSLIISNGGRVANGQGSIGYTGFSSNNSALVTGANSVWTNSGYFYVGAYGSSNSLVVSNGGTVAALISQIGTFGSSLNNSVLVTGTNSLFNNALYLFIGGSGNSGNSLVISNGGLVTVGIHSYVGGDVAADNNSVLVTGSGSRWSNASSLFVGNAGLSNILTVASGGNASVGSGLTIAASNGSVATLNIGRFGTNDTAGTITAPSIAFGAGTGALNFNQSDATTISAAISGNGAVKQLGAGTTTLSASNTYTGDTTISAGTLRFSTENGAGGSRILQTTMASLVEFLGGGRMTNEMTVFQYSFANSFEAAGQVTLADAASSIAVASGATVTGSGSFVGSGGLIKKGAGTLILGAANTYTGGTVINAGTVAISNGSSFGSNTVTFGSNGTTVAALASMQVTNNYALTGNGTMDVGANILTNSGVISGAGSLTKAGAGTMVLGAANTYTGGTTINAGTVAISNGSAFGLNTVTFASNDTTVAALASMQVTNNYALTGNGTMDVGANILTNSGVISGAGSLTKAGAGTMVLGAANAYTGGTTINAGTVAISNGSAFGLNTVTFASNGTTVAALASVPVTNNYALTGNGTMDVGANILTNSGVISGAGSLTKAGAGTMVLGAANTYSGGTTINGGTVAISNGSAFGSYKVTFASNGATVAALASVQVNNNWSLIGNGTMDVGANIILTNSGEIEGGPGRLTKSGAGTLILTAENYARTMTINEGTLQIGNGGTTGSLNWSNFPSMVNNASLIFNRSGSLTQMIAISGPGSLTKAGAGTLILSGTNTYTGGTTVNGGTLGLSGANTLADAGTVTVTGAGSVLTNNFSSQFNVGNSGSGGQLVVSNGGTVRTLGAVIGRNSTASNNKATVTGSNSLWINYYDIYVGNSGSGNSLVISNGGTVSDEGTAGQVFIGANGSSSNNSVLVTGAGSLWTNRSELYVGSSGSGNSLVISNGGTVAVSSSYIGFSSINNSVLVSGAGSLWTNSSTLSVGRGNTNNALTVSDGGTLAASAISIAANAGSSGTLNIGRLGTNDAAGTITAPTIAFGSGTGVINFNQSNSTTLSAVISGNGTVNQLGTGTTTLSGANTYTRGTVVSAGSLVGTTTSLQGAITNNAAVTFDQSTAGTYSGAMSGSGSLSKTGIGRLSLSGSSSYNGATAVSAGDLNLSGGSIANSAVTVASGASLSGYGSVGTIGGAGAINPGNSPGILTTPQVDPSGGTDFNLEMTGTAPTYNNASNSVNDVIRITGAPPFSQALAAGNGVFIYFSGDALFTGSTAVQYQGGFFTDQSASFASSISGATYNYYFANTNGPTTYNGVSYYNKAQYESLVLLTNMNITVTTVAQTANFGSGDVSGQVMQVQVVPEPSTYALLALAVAGWGAHAWRRRKQVS